MPPNEDQIAYWNGPSGQRWAAEQQSIDPGVRHYGEAAMQAAAPRPGERALDVGCGAGDTALELARRVGPAGRVVGIDISAPMLARARERLGASEGVELIEADASSYDFAGPKFDLVFSRFGVMFFDDPVGAFTNIRSALGPKGRLAFVCWRTLGENAWAKVPLEVAMAAAEAADPWPEDGPGPFALGPVGKVSSILEAAGFVDVTVEARDFEHRWGTAEPPTLEDAIDSAMSYGPGARVTATADESTKARVREALRSAFEPHMRAEGVFLGSAVYVVTATNGSGA